MLATIETLEIKGQSYTVELMAGRAVRLVKGSSVYDVTQEAGRTTCNCPDWFHRHAHLDGQSCCKHVKAVVAAGLLGFADEPAVEPEPVKAPVVTEPAFTLDATLPARKPAFDRFEVLRSWLDRPVWTRRDYKRVMDIISSDRWDALQRESDDVADLEIILQAALKEWRRINQAPSFPVTPKPEKKAAALTAELSPAFDIVAEFHAGTPIASIAKRVGVSATTIRRRLEKAGIDLPKRTKVKAEPVATEPEPTVEPVAVEPEAIVTEAPSVVRNPLFGTDPEYTLVITIGLPCDAESVSVLECHPAEIVDDSECDVYLITEPYPTDEPDPTPDPEKPTMEETTRKVHPFERAGLGKAPFKFVTPTYRPVNARGDIILGEVGGCELSTKPGGTCAYCGTAILNMFPVVSADGKRFHVGSDCIEQLDNPRLTAFVKSHKAKLAETREAERVKAAFVALPQARHALRFITHPSASLAARGLTLADYVDFLFDQGGKAGRLKAARYVETALASTAT